MVFSALALPLFLRLKRDSSLIDWVAKECEHPGAIFSLAVPLGVMGALPDIGGKNPFVYFTLFLYGYVFMRDARFQAAIDRHKASALALGVASMAVTLAVFSLRIRFSEYSPGEVLFFLLRTFNMWFWIIAVLGYGRKYLNRTHRCYRYANEASYPFYILHQTVIMAIGLYVVPWNVNLWFKFFFISLASFGLTLLLYDLCVRRTNVTRFLFGMKPILPLPGKEG